MNYSDSYKARKYKTKYLQLKKSLIKNKNLHQTQLGGAYEYIEHPDKNILVENIAEMYARKVALTLAGLEDTWFILSIGKLPSKIFIAEFNTGIGGAGATEIFKERIGSIGRNTNSYKFRPMIQVSDDIEQRKNIIKTCLLTLMNFVDNSKFIAVVSGKFWMKNIKECQCGKFFDFYGNYQNSDEFVFFKDTLIKLCMQLYKIGCKKEERCDILTPFNLIYLPPDEYNKKYIDPTGDTNLNMSYKSNYNAIKIDYVFLTYNNINITYRNDSIDVINSFTGKPTIEQIEGIFKRHPDVFTNETIINSCVFEKYMFDEIIKEKVNAIIESGEISGMKLEYVYPLLYFDPTYSICNICNSSCIKKNICTQCYSWKCSCLKYNKENKCSICHFWKCLICSNINSDSADTCIACMNPAPI